MTARRAYPQSCAGAHDSSLCGGSFLAYLHAKPPLKGEVPAKRAEGFRSPAPQGRGGSVSRRDHNQAAGIRAQPAWAHKYAGKDKPIPSHSSGGGPGEALLLEKRPPPEFFLSPVFSGGSAREGPFLKKRPLPRNHTHNSNSMNSDSWHSP